MNPPKPAPKRQQQTFADHYEAAIQAVGKLSEIERKRGAFRACLGLEKTLKALRKHQKTCVSAVLQAALLSRNASL